TGSAPTSRAFICSAASCSVALGAMTSTSRVLIWLSSMPGLLSEQDAPMQAFRPPTPGLTHHQLAETREVVAMPLQVRAGLRLQDARHVGHTRVVEQAREAVQPQRTGADVGVAIQVAAYPAGRVVQVHEPQPL